jgi:UDP-glucose 4-epimerase
MPRLDPHGPILVTGGAGFIGSTIVHALMGDGREVVVLDDLSTGSFARLPAAVHLVEHDISLSRTPEVIERLHPAAIVHAAAQVSVARSVEDPDLDRAINVVGTRHVIEGGRRAGGARLVFLSSGGAVYGEADGATETWPARPMSPYGHSKLAAEELVASSGLPYAIARLSNVYGPGQRSDLEGGVVAIFCEQARREREVVIHGDGQQVRDFVFVDDVVDALRRMLDGSQSGTWNVATGRATTVHRLLEIVEQAAGVRIGHRHVEAREGDVRVSRLDAEKSERDFGWRPRTSLEEGLSRTLLSDA